jgi:hypothetical protein
MTQRHRTPGPLATPVAIFCLLVGARGLSAQGCEPIRFTTPIDLGGEGQAYQGAGKWKFSLAYRKLYSDQFFVGTKENPAAGPNGEPSIFDIHTVVGDAAYSINSRYRIRLSVPYSTAEFRRKWADGQRHSQSAAGIGDITVSGDAWLWSPERHENGNIGVALGIKAPTGSHTVQSRFYTATSSVPFPADQTIQPGDGGWGVSLQAQGFRRVTERTFAYASGSYMVSPRAHTEVKQSPTSSIPWSVPDTYSARLGSAFSLWPDRGLSVSLGARLDGIPKRDLIGGGNDSTVKRVSLMSYVEPGFSLVRGRSAITLSVPIRMSVERKQSELEERTNVQGGGGFAKMLVFLAYSFRL